MLKYSVNPGWRVLLQDAGLNPTNVLRRARLPEDLFGRSQVPLDTSEYFGLWQAISEEAGDSLIALRIGSRVSAEAFDPLLFAALCSQDLSSALDRVSRYKRLIGPMIVHLDRSTEQTSVALEWIDRSQPPPPCLVTTELVFLVQLARIGTRLRIRPLQVTSPSPPEPQSAYADYFGVPVKRAATPVVSFSAGDAGHPFLTANEGMWSVFEPELRRRLSELDESATAINRVHAALLELLPAGAVSTEAVCTKLGVGLRTLQRRLRDEGATFQSVLNQTREGLAKHYLQTNLSGAEISFLLGFDDPNSFSRAFFAWTGRTPEQARRELLSL